MGPRARLHGLLATCRRSGLRTVECPAPSRAWALHHGLCRKSERGGTLSVVVIVLLAVLIVGAVIAFFLLRCKWCDQGTSCPAGLADAIEIVPAEVHVLHGETFTLEARLRRNGVPVDNQCADWPRWDVVSGADLVTRPPRQASPFAVAYTVDLEAPQAMVRVRARLRGGGGSLEAEAIVHVVDAPNVPGDRILARHQRASTPDIAFVTGRWGASLVTDSVIAVVGMADLGDVDLPPDQPTGAVTFFSATHAMRFRAVPWTKAVPPDVVDLDPTAAPGVFASAEGHPVTSAGPALQEVRVALWIAFRAADEFAAEAFVLDELDLADSVFRMNRAGIRFSHDPVVILPETSPQGCDAAWEELGKGPPVGYEGAWPDLADPVVHVLYCRDCAPGSAVAKSCCTPPDSSGLILIDTHAQTPSTLAHELGHTLGLRDPACSLGGGHVTGAMGFEARNLMANLIDGRSTAFRDHISLGQVFRMNVDRFSFLCRFGNCPTVPGLEAGQHCQTDPMANTPCPCLAADPVPPFTLSAAEACR